MWIERTTYITAYRFPGILKWFEVKSVSVVRSRTWMLRLCRLCVFKLSLGLLVCRAGGDQSSGQRRGDDGDGQREAEQPRAAASLRSLAVHQPAVHDAQRHRRPRRHGRLLQLREGFLSFLLHK